MKNEYKDVTQNRSHINNQAFSILILEDDTVYQRILSFHLTELRYKVHVAGTIESFWHQLEAEKPDLLVIDMRLPDGTGFGVLHQVRETDKLIPIVVVSALDKPVERELAYNSGADVFLVKPVHINELMAVVKRFQSRVSAICAQMATAELAHSNPNETWRLLKTESLLISPNGKQLLLTTTEFAFLEFLALSEQEASRTTIAHYLKSVRLKDGHGYDGALNTMISRLRKRWSEVDASPLPIRAIRGTGYAFASHGGLTLVRDRRDDHFNRVVLHHFAAALSSEEGILSDMHREMAKTLFKGIKVAVPTYFLNRAADVCDVMIGNSSDIKQDYEQLLHSEEARAQFLVVMVHFIRFLLESPNERLHWLMNVLRFDDAENDKPHDSVLVSDDNSDIGQIVGFLTQICHYLNRLCNSEVVVELIRVELVLVDVRHFLTRMIAELAELERALIRFNDYSSQTRVNENE
jgi:DNA-binding response OmpR family regulator